MYTWLSSCHPTPNHYDENSVLHYKIVRRLIKSQKTSEPIATEGSELNLNATKTLIKSLKVVYCLDGITSNDQQQQHQQDQPSDGNNSDQNISFFQSFDTMIDLIESVEGLAVKPTQGVAWREVIPNVPFTSPPSMVVHNMMTMNNKQSFGTSSSSGLHNNVNTIGIQNQQQRFNPLMNPMMINSLQNPWISNQMTVNFMQQQQQQNNSPNNPGHHGFIPPTGFNPIMAQTQQTSSSYHPFPGGQQSSSGLRSDSPSNIYAPASIINANPAAAPAADGRQHYLTPNNCVNNQPVNNNNPLKDWLSNISMKFNQLLQHNHSNCSNGHHHDHHHHNPMMLNFGSCYPVRNRRMETSHSPPRSSSSSVKYNNRLNFLTITRKSCKNDRNNRSSRSRILLSSVNNRNPSNFLTIPRNSQTGSPNRAFFHPAQFNNQPFMMMNNSNITSFNPGHMMSQTMGRSHHHQQNLNQTPSNGMMTLQHHPPPPPNVPPHLRNNNNSAGNSSSGNHPPPPPTHTAASHQYQQQANPTAQNVAPTGNPASVLVSGSSSNRTRTETNIYEMDPLKANRIRFLQNQHQLEQQQQQRLDTSSHNDPLYGRTSASTSGRRISMDDCTNIFDHAVSRSNCSSVASSELLMIMSPAPNSMTPVPTFSTFHPSMMMIQQPSSNLLKIKSSSVETLIDYNHSSNDDDLTVTEDEDAIIDLNYDESLQESEQQLLKELAMMSLVNKMSVTKTPIMNESASSSDLIDLKSLKSSFSHQSLSSLTLSNLVAMTELLSSVSKSCKRNQRDDHHHPLVGEKKNEDHHDLDEKKSGSSSSPPSSSSSQDQKDEKDCMQDPEWNIQDNNEPKITLDEEKVQTAEDQASSSQGSGELRNAASSRSMIQNHNMKPRIARRSKSSDNHSSTWNDLKYKSFYANHEVISRYFRNACCTAVYGDLNAGPDDDQMNAEPNDQQVMQNYENLILNQEGDDDLRRTLENTIISSFGLKCDDPNVDDGPPVNPESSTSDGIQAVDNPDDTSCSSMASKLNHDDMKEFLDENIKSSTAEHSYLNFNPNDLPNDPTTSNNIVDGWPQDHFLQSGR